MRHVVDDQQPLRPIGQDLGLSAVDGLIHGWDQLPDVTKQEDPDDRHRDPRQAILRLVVLIVRAEKKSIDANAENSVKSFIYWELI